jgi:hypothetical protein
LVVDGVTGILCADEEEMARAIPRACRAHAEACIARDRTARQHLDPYARVLGDGAHPVPEPTRKRIPAPGISRER